MAKLVIYIPEQRYEFDLDDNSAERFRAALADTDNEWAFEDMADSWVSDVHVEMESEFVDG